MSTLVSVIIPTYNRMRLLPRAIDSALSQTWSNLEVVVVDDGSTDGTERMVRGRYGADSRVRYFRQANAGVCAARNRALSAALGDYIAFLDSDDEWKHWKIELQLKCLDWAADVGMVWTDMEAVGPSGNVTAPRHLKSMYSAWRWFTEESLFERHRAFTAADLGIAEAPGGVFHVGDVFGPMVMGNLAHTSTVLLTRARLQKVGGFDPSFGRAAEDHDFHLRTCREGPVGFIDVPTIRYQTGLPDRLTALRDQFPINFLRTLERSMAQDRERIRLPYWLIKTARAQAHGWLGECLLDRGDRRQARQHLLASLRLRPQQPRIAAQFVLSCAPAPVDRAARAVWRRARRSVQESAPRGQMHDAEVPRD
jgi:GT2 family glycosyltransferase